jgi:hypothetical protein
MYEASALSLILLLCVICLSYDIGASIVSALPKAPHLCQSLQFRLTAFSLSPFIASFLALFSLGVSPFLLQQRALTLFWCLLVGAVIVLRLTVKRIPAIKAATLTISHSPNERTIDRFLKWFFGGLLIAWLGLMTLDASFLPLTQNDALEYFTVANLIADHQSLWVYPAINPTLEHSRGFYGPWTHPPTYTAMLAMLNLIQGGASSTPGILRALAPWFLIAAVCGIYVIGSLRSKLCGLAAAALLVSMPLLILGAGSSLIDSLTVGAVVLVFLALTNIQKESKLYFPIVGVTVGIGAWTHSQTLLLLPMFAAVTFIAISLGRNGWKKALAVPTLVLLVALVIACAPYLRNFIVLGSLVSDNPVVFALPELKWEEYVRASRGYVSAVDIIQYGLFKGWFLVEAYGIVFWIATLALWPQIRSASSISQRMGATSSAQFRFEYLAVAFFVIYFLGVLLSILLRMDIMIKNERYLLIIAPAVSLLAAVAVSEAKPLAIPIEFRSAFMGLSLLALVGALIYTSVYRLPQLLIARTSPYLISEADKLVLRERLQALDNEVNEKSTLQSTQGQKPSGITIQRSSHETELDYSMHFDPRLTIVERGLSNWANTFLAKKIRLMTEPSANILAIRPADMYYSRDRKMISFLDPRMVPLYKSTSMEAALLELEKLNITHVQMPDYSTPIFFNTQLEAILGTPALSRLLLDVDGNQLYQLKPSNLKLGEVVNLVDPLRPWTIDHSWEIAARKSLFALGNKSEIQFAAPQANDLNHPVFKRNMTTALSSGLGAYPQKTFTEFNARVLPSTEYLLQIRLRGRAYVEASVNQYGSSGMPTKGAFAQGSRSIKLMEFPLNSDEDGALTIKKRFKTLDRSASLRLTLLFRGAGSLQVEHASLTELIQ